VITGPSSVANCGLIFIFVIRYPNWYIATKIRVIKNKYKRKTRFQELRSPPELKLRHCRPQIKENLGTDAYSRS
jgi:hypothetical protein